MRTLAVVVVLAAALTACATGTAPQTAPFTTAQQAFLTAARAAGAPVGTTPSNSEAQFVALAQRICTSAPTMRRTDRITEMTSNGFLSEAAAGQVADAAITHTCPGTVFQPEGPRTSFGDGTWLVGTDVRPGTYRTPGATRSALPNCYWQRSRGTSGQLSDIIANDNGTGPAVVTIAASDAAFTSKGCAAWMRVG